MGNYVKVKKRKKPKKYKKRVLNIRQENAKRNMLENGSSQGQAMRDAGYSAAYAMHPEKFKATQAGQKLISMCNRIRDKSLKRAEELANEAPYGDVVRGADTLNKMSRLEGGESTENVEIKHLTDSLKNIAEGDN